jgi:hypothetical protein
VCHWPLSYESFVAEDIIEGMVDVEVPVDNVKVEV